MKTIIFNDSEYITETIEDYLNDIEIKYIAGFIRPKEVKKVRPYFECKVVKVKKRQIKPRVKTLILRRRAHDKAKEECIKVKINDPKLYLFRHENSKIGDEAVYPNRKIWKIIKIIEPKEPKGNWVNGENLDKIKFPCFCSYIDKMTKEKSYAKINQGHGGFKLSRLFQANGDSIFYGDVSLKRLIKNLNIHILKGKIILFEEEE